MQLLIIFKVFETISRVRYHIAEAQQLMMVSIITFKLGRMTCSK